MPIYPRPPSRWPQLWRALMSSVLALWCALQAVSALAQTTAPNEADAAQARLALESDIRLWLARHQGVDPQRVAVTPLDARLRVPECPGGWAMSLPFNNAQSVRARCDSVAPVRQYILRTAVEDVTQEVAATRDLPAGHTLAAQDLILRPVLPGQSAAFTDPAPLLGRVLSQGLSRNQSVREQQLSQQVTIYRLARSTFAGDTLRPSDVLSSSLPATQAPDNFWSGAWPAQAVISRSLPAGHIVRSDDWAAMVPAVVAQVDIPRGTLLTPEMLRVVSLPEPSGGVPYVDSIAQLAYSETVRAIGREQPLTRLDVRAAVLVKRGSKVVITVGKGQGFEISTQVEALEDGRLGEQIRLINRESGRMVSGRVTAANQVEAL